MRRLVAGGLACAFAGASVLATATLGGAQEEPVDGFVVLDATVSPEVAGPGEQVTVSPVQPCTLEGEGPGTLYWFWFIDAEVEEPMPGEHYGEGEAPLGADGSWEVSFPASSLDGEYFFSGLCLPNGIDGYLDEIEACFPDEFPEEPEEVAPAANTLGGDEGGEPPTTVTMPPTEPTTTVPEEPGFDCLFESYEVLFTVEGGTPPVTVPPGTGTPPPVAPPATPVTEDPPFTG
jgi:hypothetical protein